VVFVANYGVTLAETIIPGAELSEQISTAGTEASGTGNMKFALNGALTIGTLDGANVEIREEVGPDNIFTFGLTAEEVVRLRAERYDPRGLLPGQPELRRILELLESTTFCPGQPGLFVPVVRGLVEGGDPYMLVADFESYRECQERVAEAYRSPARWDRMSILNVAGMGRFSSDRTIRDYAREIWDAKPAPVEKPASGRGA
jgi:starch phosphorylase